MKKLSLKSGISSLILAVGVSVFFTQAASAYTVYKLKDKYYAIVCADGQIFSYSGGAGGIGIVGEELCSGHGGLAGGPGGPTILPATKQILSASQTCGRPVNVSKRIDKSSTKCSMKVRASVRKGTSMRKDMRKGTGKIRVNRIDMS